MKKEELLQDWFVRSDEGYILCRESIRLSSRERRGRYSADLHGLKPKEAVKKAHKISKALLSSMNIGKCHIALHRDSSFTDGKRVFVSSEMFDDTNLTTAEMIDVFSGLSIHEGCHVLFTDFKHNSKNKTIHTIANIIEDERIERIICERKPGFADFLGATKKYYFDTKRETSKDVTLEDLATKLINIFLQIIRYPKYLTDEDIDFFVTDLFEIKEILTPYPTSTKGVTECAEKIYEVLKKYLKESGKAGGSSSGDDSESDEEGSGESSKSEDENGEESSSSSFGDKSEEEGSTPMTDEEIDAKIEEILGKLFTALTPTEMTDETSQIKDVDLKVIDESLELCKGHFIIREKNNRRAYEQAYRTVAPYVRSVNKLFIYRDDDIRLVDKSCRSGQLDTTKIAELVQGVETIYENYSMVSTDSLTVALLVDLSGSMGNTFAGQEYSEWAKRSAILLNEAFRQIKKIKLYIYGHTADISETGKVDFYVYKEDNYDAPYSLGNVEAKANNRDGDALRVLRERVRKQTKGPCLVIVLADGNPYASGYSGGKAEQDTAKAVRELEADNFTVMQVAITSSVSANMYRNNIKFTDVKKLPQALAGITKKLILQLQKRR